MSSIKHIIWDWNGTLLDDIDVSMTALNILLESEHLPLVLDINEYRKYFQFPVREYYKKVGFDFEKTPFTLLAQKYMDYYQPHSFTCSLHDGALDTLQKAQDNGIKQYLLSASNLTFLKEQVANYPIAQYFTSICGLDNIHASSKAALAKEFVEANGFSHDSVVFVGDSVHDSEVAHGANCHCILIANGHEHRKKLEDTGCKVVDSMREFEQLLDII